MENKIKHLEMIQNVVTRMAGNSFLLKGWSVTLVSALIALSAAGTDRRFMLIAFFPSIMFWILDGYFLRQERLFRKLYDNVRQSTETSVDFSMNTAPFARDVSPLIGVIFSQTLILFYGAIIGVITLLMLVVGF
jgi:hypothetical protein